CFRRSSTRRPTASRCRPSAWRRLSRPTRLPRSSRSSVAMRPLRSPEQCCPSTAGREHRHRRRVARDRATRGALRRALPARLRRRLGLPPEPAFAVLTGSGSRDPEHRALDAGALVLTTERGAAALAGRLRDGVEVAVLPGSDLVELPAAVALLLSRGLTAILSEAGPTMFGALLDAGLV